MCGVTLNNDGTYIPNNHPDWRILKCHRYLWNVWNTKNIKQTFATRTFSDALNALGVKT
jgi:hypothetical protein